MDLNFEPNSEIIVGCIPVEAFPVPPKDYQNPYVGKCEQCDADVWMSDKKKEVKETYSHAKCLCMLCCAKIMYKNKGQMNVHNIGEGKRDIEVASNEGDIEI